MISRNKKNNEMNVMYFGDVFIDGVANTFQIISLLWFILMRRSNKDNILITRCRYKNVVACLSSVQLAVGRQVPFIHHPLPHNCNFECK